jgi:hypothetical protein
MKLKFAKLVPGAALLCIVLASCKKNEAVTSHSSSQSSSPLIRTTTMIGAMGDQSDMEMNDVIATDRPDGSDCPVVTYNPSKDVYPNVKTVDYGTGCTDSYGITTSGKKFVTSYGDKSTAPAGKVISVTTFSNFYVNGVSISGNIKVTVVKPFSSGQLILRNLVTKTASDAYGNTSSFINIGTQKQIAGNGTDTSTDDVFEIWENAHGTEISGDSAMVTWTSVTDPANPVIKESSCRFRTQGALIIALKELGVITNEYLDYGNGDCDDQATIAVNGGDPQPITLPFYFFAGEF